MQAKSIKGNSTGEIQSALQQCITNDFKPTLAIVFMSVKQDREAVCSLLNEQGIQIFGSTTSGEFISSEISEGGIAIMLLDPDPALFQLVFLETGGSSAYEVSKQLGVLGKNSFAQAAFLVASGWLHTDGERIIKGIEEGYQGEPAIYGGMAGDDLALSGPIVFTQGKSSITGLVAIIIDTDRVEVSGIATCGWKPIGITKTVTKSEGNVVYTMDDQPALDLVIKYLGLNMDDMNAITNTVFNLGAYYPLQLEREDAPPVMRTAMLGNKEDRSLICAGNVPQGSKVRFSLPPDFDVIDTVVNECSDLKTGNRNGVDAVIMFSCISRYLSFGVMTSEEIERVMGVWNAPFIGFFSYGEYGKSRRGKHEFHNNTCCVVTLKEIR
ncbi:MAG TPA: FIST N-terminal domain-containing protein, partial [Saprospiraceae bacterium]|nr:FIST N-terminal domain-containing protein [Saprospiraceae bacterium]HNT19126.1 FIST N-terminal domain-containing protein [Saprospiraceae bacterium]